MNMPMRPAFTMTFSGPEDRYTLGFEPAGKWNGVITVTIAAHPMQWDVLHFERDKEGGIVLCGMTTGSEQVWNDQFWFELRPDDNPPVRRFWGDQVVWREDYAA